MFSYSFAIYDSFNMFEDNWRQGFHKNNHKSDWSQLMSKRTTCTPSLKNRLLFVSLKSPNLIIRLILIMSYPFVSGLSQVTWSMAWKFNIWHGKENYKHSYASFLFNKMVVWFVKRKDCFTNYKQYVLISKRCYCIKRHV